MPVPQPSFYDFIQFPFQFLVRYLNLFIPINTISQPLLKTLHFSTPPEFSAQIDQMVENYDTTILEIKKHLSRYLTYPQPAQSLFQKFSEKKIPSLSNTNRIRAYFYEYLVLLLLLEKSYLQQNTPFFKPKNYYNINKTARLLDMTSRIAKLSDNPVILEKQLEIINHAIVQLVATETMFVLNDVTFEEFNLWLIKDHTETEGDEVTLSLKGQGLTRLPKGFEQLTSVAKLDLSYNCIIQPLSRLLGLTQLKWLNLFGNQITTLPFQSENFPPLNYLNITNTALTWLPESLNVAVQECAAKVPEDISWVRKGDTQQLASKL